MIRCPDANIQIAEQIAVKMRRKNIMATNDGIKTDIFNRGDYIISKSRTEQAIDGVEEEISGLGSRINSKQDKITVTASRVLVSDGNGIVSASGITSTELGCLTDVTSNIQSQIDGKLNTDGSNGTSAGVSALINKLTVGTADPQDGDYYVSQYAGGGSTTATYHRRPLSALWNWIKGKISSVLGLTASNYNGKAENATNADKSLFGTNLYYCETEGFYKNKVIRVVNNSPYRNKYFFVHFKHLNQWGKNTTASFSDNPSTKYTVRIGNIAGTGFMENLGFGNGIYLCWIENSYINIYPTDSRVRLVGNYPEEDKQETAEWFRTTPCSSVETCPHAALLDPGSNGVLVMNPEICIKKDSHWYNGDSGGNYNWGTYNEVMFGSAGTLVPAGEKILFAGDTSPNTHRTLIDLGFVSMYEKKLNTVNLLKKQFTTDYSAVKEPDHILCLANNWAAAGYMSKNNFINWIRGKIINVSQGFYAPTSAGTSGQILTSNGSGAPVWKSRYKEITERNIILANGDGNAQIIEFPGISDLSHAICLKLMLKLSGFSSSYSGTIMFNFTLRNNYSSGVPNIHNSASTYIVGHLGGSCSCMVFRNKRNRIRLICFSGSSGAITDGYKIDWDLSDLALYVQE